MIVSPITVYVTPDGRFNRLGLELFAAQQRETDTSIATLTEAVAPTFETVSKNLDASDATFAYSGGNLDTIIYASGVVKTFAYSGGDLVSVTLSGATPDGIDLVKTFTYSGGDLTAVTYS
jgi:hypothetical protein